MHTLLSIGNGEHFLFIDTFGVEAVALDYHFGDLETNSSRSSKIKCCGFWKSHIDFPSVFHSRRMSISHRVAVINERNRQIDLWQYRSHGLPSHEAVKIVTISAQRNSWQRQPQNVEMSHEWFLKCLLHCQNYLRNYIRNFRIRWLVISIDNAGIQRQYITLARSGNWMLFETRYYLLQYAVGFVGADVVVCRHPWRIVDLWLRSINRNFITDIQIP